MIRVATAADMHALGKRIGAQCVAGDLILLNGPPPTFVISRIHKGPLPLIHVDAYRLLEGGKAALYLDDLDLDSPREGAVTVIEWGGAESARLSDERLEIVIDRTEEIREVSITPVGTRWQGFSA